MNWKKLEIDPPPAGMPILVAWQQTGHVYHGGAVELYGERSWWVTSGERKAIDWSDYSEHGSPTHWAQWPKFIDDYSEGE